MGLSIHWLLILYTAADLETNRVSKGHFLG